MDASFQPLFTIQLLHDYYDKHEKRCADFDLVPAEDCIQLMKGRRVLYRNYGNQLATLISASRDTPSTFKPFVELGEGMIFRYYLVLKNPYFSNITAVALPVSERKRLYFSNFSGNNAGGKLSLSTPVDAFGLSKTYHPGDLVKGPGDNFYEAIRLGDGTAASKDLNDINYWQQTVVNDPYVSSGDQLIMTGDYYTYRLQVPAKNIIVKIFGLNTADASLPYNLLLETVEKSFAQNQETFTIDLSKKRPGKYRIVVNNEDDEWVYVDPAALRQNVTGVVEIHHFAKVPAAFRLLTGAGQLRTPEPRYTIQFKNRSVIWKYFSPNEISVADSGLPVHNFITEAPGVVRSERAIGLTEKPLSTLTATRTGTGRQIKNLKNPDIQKLSFERDGDTGFFAGKMYVRIDT